MSVLLGREVGFVEGYNQVYLLLLHGHELLLLLQFIVLVLLLGVMNLFAHGLHEGV